MELAQRRFSIVSRVVIGANTIPLVLGAGGMVKLLEMTLIGLSPGQWLKVDMSPLLLGALAIYGLGVVIFLAHLRACLPVAHSFVLALWIATLAYNAGLLGLALILPAPLTWLSLWPGITCGVGLWVLASLGMSHSDNLERVN
jgi:hypothetical protein